MRRFIFALAAVSTLAMAAPASAEPVTIAPSSAWNVDFAEDKCRLARIFGDGDRRHLVFFEQYWPGSSFGLTVAGPEFKSFRSRKQTELGFFDGQERQSGEPFTGTVGEYGPGVIYSSASLTAEPDEDETTTRVAELDTTLAAQVHYVGLKQRGSEVRLLTGPLDEAFAVLNRCTSELIAEWGLDPEEQRQATRRPVWTNMESVVRRIQASYPRSAVNKGEQGLVRMRVIVGSDGAVENCTTIKATDTKQLESPACSAMRTAEFSPGLDSAGQPMRSFYVTSITYQIGG